MVSPIVVAYDEILSGPFKTYCELSQKIGGDVGTHGAMVEAAFQEQRQFLVIVSKSKKPAANDLQPLLLSTSNKIQEIQEFREKNRRSIYFNHLSAISESIPALGWVTVVSALKLYWSNLYIVESINFKVLSYLEYLNHQLNANSILCTFYFVVEIEYHLVYQVPSNQVTMTFMFYLLLSYYANCE